MATHIIHLCRSSCEASVVLSDLNGNWIWRN